MPWRNAFPLLSLLVMLDCAASSAELDQAQVTEDRFNFLIPSHKALPEISDALAILTINICSENPPVLLQKISIENTITERRYVLRPYQSQSKISNPSDRVFDARQRMQYIERNDIVQHTFFLDAPSGTYRITDVGLVRKRRGKHISYRINNIENLFFWYDDYASLSYLGELNISIGDGSSVASSLIVTRTMDRYIEDIKTRFPALADLRIDHGNLWHMGSGGGQITGNEIEVVCQFPLDALQTDDQSSQ
jgi:hypothetical protein